MKAVILAAGMGSRLGAIGRNGPKCLLPVGDTSLLHILLHSIRAARGVDQILVVGGYKIEELRSRLPVDATLVENREFAATNSLYSLWLAIRDLAPTDLSVFNADVLYQPALVTRFLDAPRGSAVLVDELRPHDPREFQVQVEDGKVVDFRRNLSPEFSAGQDAQAFKVSEEDFPAWRDAVGARLGRDGRRKYAGESMRALADSRRLRPVFTNNQFWFEVDSEEEYRACIRAMQSTDEDIWAVDSYGSEAPPGGQPTPQPSPPEGNGGIEEQRGPGPRHPIAYPLRRGLECLLRGELPWRYRWLPDLLRVSRETPGTAIPLVPGVVRGDLTIAGFKLLAHGRWMLTSLMEDADTVGVRPFLLWGTLLGHVREGGFIRNDHDLDLGMLEEDFQKIDALRERLEHRGFRLRHQDRGKLSMKHPTADGLWLDIDLLEEEGGHMVSTNREKEGFDYSYLFPRTAFEELRRDRFMGTEVFVPGDPEAVLEAIYGDWRTPRPKSNFLKGPLNVKMAWKSSRIPPSG